LRFEPPFRPSAEFLDTVNAGAMDLDISAPGGETDAGAAKTKLDKKHHQTIQAAVSELYFLEKYTAVKEIIVWAKEYFEKDKKWDAQVKKWEGKIEGKMQEV
jgi:hypothetical protein